MGKRVPDPGVTEAEAATEAEYDGIALIQPWPPVVETRPAVAEGVEQR